MMAQDVTIVVWCDWCDLLGMPKVSAARSRVIAIDGPQRRIDVCRRCDLLLADIEELYQARGQELSADPTKRTGLKGAAVGHEAMEISAAEQPKLKEKLYVVCPLPHRGKQSGPKRVAYSDRDAHAAQVHDIRMWDLEWEDPGGILAVPCEAHKECRATGLRFTSVRGRNNHIDKSPLERIDTSG